VAVGANVRSGPGLTFDVVGSVATGGQVLLRGQRDGWYQVTTPDGTEGWMAAQVLNLPPQAPTTVPTVIP
jgi:N-acetylmuramoyl-L-alanine amidase